jgi:hypothetical protein
MWQLKVLRAVCRCRNAYGRERYRRLECGNDSDHTKESFIAVMVTEASAISNLPSQFSFQLKIEYCNAESNDF